MKITFALAMGLIAGSLTNISAGLTVSISVWLLLVVSSQAFREE